MLPYGIKWLVLIMVELLSGGVNANNIGRIENAVLALIDET